MRAWLLPAIIAVGVASAAFGETAPQAGLTRQQAEIAFVTDLLFPCVTHVQRGVAIAELPSEYRADLVGAEGADAVRTIGGEHPTAVWISKALGSHLKVLELGPSKCMVTADQLPVDETLRKAAEATEHLTPPFTPVDFKPGYNPVVYETQGLLEGRQIKVHLEGAEPGLPGHAYRFSLLMATVTSSPAP